MVYGARPEKPVLAEAADYLFIPGFSLFSFSPSLGLQLKTQTI